MKHFNLELASQGHPIILRSGWPCRLICHDRMFRNKTKHLIVLVYYDNGHEEILKLNTDGTALDFDHRDDLFMREDTDWIRTDNYNSWDEYLQQLNPINE